VKPRRGPRSPLPVEDAILVLVLALVPVVFSRLTEECFEIPQSMLLTTAALVLLWRVLSRELAAIGRPGPARYGTALPGRFATWARRDPLGAGVLLFLGSSVASTIASPNPGLSLHGAPDSTAGLVAAFATAAVYFTSRAISRGQPTTLIRYAKAAGFASLVTSLYALMQLLGWDPLVWGRTATFEGEVRIFGTLGHPNMLGAYLAMTTPLVVWLALGARGVERIAWGLVTTVSVIVIAATLSRGAWIGLFAAALTWALLSLVVKLRSGGTSVSRGSRVPERRSAIPAALGISLLVAGMAAFLFARAPMGAHLAERVRQIASMNAPTTRSRLLIWQGGLRMAHDHPVLGVGVDAFGIAYSKYRDPRYWKIEFGHTPNKAHNEPIEILATQGIVGGVAALAVVLFASIAAFRAIRRKESAVRSGAIAATASLAAFAAQDLASFTVVALGCLAAATAGWISSAAAGDVAERDPGARPKRERVPVWAKGAALVFAAALFVEIVLLPLRAQLYEKRGMKAPLGSPDRAWALTQASRYAPWDSRYPNLLGNSLLVQSGIEPDPERKRDLLRQAASAIHAATVREPQNPYYRSNLGRVATAQAMLRPPDATETEVRRAFEEAMRRDPANAQVTDQAAMALITLGQAPEARAITLRSARMYPELAQPMAFFGYVALLEKRWSDAKDTLEIAVRREWFGEKEARAATWSNLSAAYLALGRDQDALRAAEEGLTFNPESPDARANRDLARRRLDAGGSVRGGTGTMGSSR